MTNNTGKYEFTIIVPIFNEEEGIGRLVERLSAFLPKALCKTCLLMVNDGSSDGSLRGIQQACAENAHFYYISLSENCGLSAALKSGIDTVESPYVGYIDADLQTAPEDFNLLLPYRQDFQLVTGYRVGRKDTIMKRIQSRIANGFRRMMTHDGATDTGCPLKVMRTDYARRIPFFNGMHRFLPALILLQGAEVKQIGVRHFPRTTGVSKYNLWNRLIGPFADCFAYRWMKKRYINYTINDSRLA